VRVLVLNCGSSSVKWRLFDELRAVDGGTVERVTAYGAALRQVLSTVDADGLDAVGHRVVHGGLRFSAPVLIDDGVTEAVEELIPLAPLHNPPNLAGMREARRLLPRVPQVAVFDTAFHRSIPPQHATYAIDAAIASEHAIHRYGFHGTSHAYVSRQTAALLGREPSSCNVITLHLGNGASACAVRGGVSFATSMGLSPLEGLVMGTRSGDIDPEIVFHLHRVVGMDWKKIEDMLNTRSGLRGLCGDHDMRDVLARTDGRARLALGVYCARIKFYVGAYYALLGRLDAITFTAGVGENSAEVRRLSLHGLDGLGIAIDAERNNAGGPIISAEDARVRVCVVPTNEELEIATQATGLLQMR
jgi:acetate kinase